MMRFNSKATTLIFCFLLTLVSLESIPKSFAQNQKAKKTQWSECNNCAVISTDPAPPQGISQGTVAAHVPSSAPVSTVPENRCNLKRADSLRLLSIIDAADKTEQSCGQGQENVLDKDFKSNVSLIRKTLGVTATEPQPSKNDLVEFTQALWSQAMANLVVSRLDFEMRYTKDKNNTHPIPNINKIINELDEQNGASGKSRRGTTASNLGSGGLKLAQSQGAAYIASFKTSGIEAITAAEAGADLKVREKFLRDAYQATVGKLDKRATQQQKNEALQNYNLLESQVYSSGPGILHYTEALSKKLSITPVSGALAIAYASIPSASVTDAFYSTPETNEKNTALALEEYKKTNLAAASELNAKTDWALHDPYGAPNIAAILNIIEANPLAAGQLLNSHPKFKNQICFYLQHIEDIKQLNDVLLNGMHGIMMATMVVGGASALPDLLLMRMGARTVANLVTVRAINGSVASSAFVISAGSDIIKKTNIIQETKTVRAGVLNGSGQTPEQLDEILQEGSAASEAIVYDALFATVGSAARQLTKNLHGATEMKELGKVSEDMAELGKKFQKTKQMQAGFHIFNLICGSLNANCGVLLSAFEHLPGSPSERLAKQQKILSSNQAIKDFVKDTFSKKNEVPKSEFKSTDLSPIEQTEPQTVKNQLLLKEGEKPKALLPEAPKPKALIPEKAQSIIDQHDQKTAQDLIAHRVSPEDPSLEISTGTKAIIEKHARIEQEKHIEKFESEFKRKPTEPLNHLFYSEQKIAWEKFSENEISGVEKTLSHFQNTPELKGHIPELLKSIEFAQSKNLEITDAFLDVKQKLASAPSLAKEIERLEKEVREDERNNVGAKQDYALKRKLGEKKSEYAEIFRKKSIFLAGCESKHIKNASDGYGLNDQLPSIGKTPYLDQKLFRETSKDKIEGLNQLETELKREFSRLEQDQSIMDQALSNRLIHLATLDPDPAVRAKAQETFKLMFETLDHSSYKGGGPTYAEKELLDLYFNGDKTAKDFAAQVLNKSQLSDMTMASLNKEIVENPNSPLNRAPKELPKFYLNQLYLSASSEDSKSDNVKKAASLL